MTTTPALAPFWTRLSAFFIWPLQFGPLVYISTLVVASIGAVFLPFIGGLLLLVIWFFFFRYAMTVLVQAARGNFGDDADVAIESGDRRPIKQSLYLTIVTVIIVLITLFVGPMAGLVCALLVSIGLPAAVIVIAIHDNLSDALNPLQILSVISAIGAPYFLLCLFLLLLQGGNLALFRFIGPAIPRFIEFPVLTFISMYFLLVMYHMMGYVVYQYHERLGYGVDKTFDQNQIASPNAPKAVKLSPRDQKIADLVANGDIQGAIDELKDDMRYERNHIGDNQKLHKLYLALGDNDKTLSHATQFIPWLLAAHHCTDAIDLFVKARTMEPAFAISNADDILPLAKAAKSRRNGDLAMELIKGFDKKNPKHRDIPAVYFLAAQILSETMNDDVQAIRILNAIVTRFPETSIAAEAKQYLDVLVKTSLIKAPTAAPAVPPGSPESALPAR